MCAENQSQEVNFLRYEVRQIFLLFWVIFCLFNPLPLTTQKNKIFKKWKKSSGDVIILNLCNKKHDHMMYAYSDMECLRRHNCFLFQAIFCIFCSFTAILTPEIKIWKKCKKHLGILSFYTCVPLIKTIWCMDPEIWSSTDRIFLSWWTIFCPFASPLPPNSRKITIWKKWKRHLEIS